MVMKMNELLKNIEKFIIDNECLTTAMLKTSSLKTIIRCYSSLCCNKISEFTIAFNELFKENSEHKNYLHCSIIEDITLFEEAERVLSNNSLFIQTKRIDEFNKATITTSVAKCSTDKNVYIIKCYDYFIYLFNKIEKKCYMLIKQNKKALTMVNILLLTPYLMYRNLYAVHGGLVNKDNYNILINNSSLGGKTTFALLFATHGWNIITEETTYINSDGFILPYNIRNYFNIRVGTYLSFKKFFLNKNIIHDDFLAMEHKNENELFDYGKKSQLSIDFDELGSHIQLENMKITTSLRVSIEKNRKLDIQECPSTENVNSFLELSLAPTVLLFQDLLNYQITDKEERKNDLIRIFSKTSSFILKSGFDYKEQFEIILNKIKN